MFIPTFSRRVPFRPIATIEKLSYSNQQAATHILVVGEVVVGRLVFARLAHLGTFTWYILSTDLVHHSSVVVSEMEISTAVPRCSILSGQRLSHFHCSGRKKSAHSTPHLNAYWSRLNTLTPRIVPCSRSAKASAACLIYSSRVIVHLLSGAGRRCMPNA